jgi:hypothetical protein
MLNMFMNGARKLIIFESGRNILVTRFGRGFF